MGSIKFKIFNENGIVKITKIENGIESVLFADVLAGQCAEIEVNSYISYSACYEQKA